MTLETFYSPDGPERVGFILKDGNLVEVENIASDPVQGFKVKGEDLLKCVSDAKATWHTHPGETFNLSVSDYIAFKSYPKLTHFIIGSNGVREYYVENGEVFIRA